jgi:hypothetical protein
VIDWYIGPPKTKVKRNVRKQKTELRKGIICSCYSQTVSQQKWAFLLRSLPGSQPAEVVPTTKPPGLKASFNNKSCQAIALCLQSKKTPEEIARHHTRLGMVHLTEQSVLAKAKRMQSKFLSF